LPWLLAARKKKHRLLLRPLKPPLLRLLTQPRPPLLRLLTQPRPPRPLPTQPLLRRPLPTLLLRPLRLPLRLLRLLLTPLRLPLLRHRSNQLRSIENRPAGRFFFVQRFAKVCIIGRVDGLAVHAFNRNVHPRIRDLDAWTRDSSTLPATHPVTIKKPAFKAGFCTAESATVI